MPQLLRTAWVLAVLLSAPGSSAPQAPPRKNSPQGNSLPARRDIRPVEARRPRWAPVDVDAQAPPIKPGVPCSLEPVLEQAGARVQQLAANLERFTATERIEHTQVTEEGKPVRRSERAFDYLVSFRELQSGEISVDEVRDGSEGLTVFFGRVATRGLPGLVLIFHPYYLDDFVMRCEGQGEWRGQTAWLVHFQQRAGRPSRLNRLRVGAQTYDINLRGRAWISAQDGNILRLEADLVEPVEKAGLWRHHKIVEYRPVQFASPPTELWLPERAEIYLHIGRHRYQIRHAFSDYLLFSIKLDERISDPTPPQ